MEKIVLIGFGGHALSVVDSIERMGKYKIEGFTELNKSISKYKYLGTDSELKKIYSKGISNAFICIGYLGKSSLRNRIYSEAKKIGFKFPTIIDPSAIVSQSVHIGEGSFIGKNVIINAQTVIGINCIINTGAIIEHQCLIEDYSHVAVGATLCGNVKIGKNSFVGANATIIQDISLEEYSLVPAGMVVRKSNINEIKLFKN